MTSESVVIVTGAAQGIGCACAEVLHEVGYFVVGLDVCYPPDRPTHRGCVDLALHCDVSIRDHVVEAARAVADLRQEVAAVVNNAGVFFAGDFTELDNKCWNRMLQVNLIGPMNTCREFFRLLRDSDYASVVNVASTDGIVASAGQHCEIGVCHDVHYAVTKGALVTLTRALAMAWASCGIRVNAVAPTITETRMCEDLLRDPEVRSRLSGSVPLGALAAPEDVAGAVEFLVSRRARMITGHVLPIDGGYLCR